MNPNMLVVGMVILLAGGVAVGYYGLDFFARPIELKVLRHAHLVPQLLLDIRDAGDPVSQGQTIEAENGGDSEAGRARARHGQGCRFSCHWAIAFLS
jgi:hypothetical protein